MQKFHNILFVSHGVADETQALTQTLSLAHNNKATLKALVVCPEFPKAMSDYKGTYEVFLKEQLQTSIKAARELINVSETDVPVSIEVESGDIPAIRTIRHILKGAHDLLIKAAEPKEGGKGFMAMDMELLRKCPCPVWLARPIYRHREAISVAVAIDPQTAASGHELSLRLLALSGSLSDTCSRELHIISCWHYEFEEYLRNNMWMNISEDELNRMLQIEQTEHRTSLEGLLKKSAIQGNLQIHHLRGRPDKTIAQYVADKDIDILVMGTVARTGINSFVIGNTAENIVQKLGCSLLALKPSGFVSPVKAY